MKIAICDDEACFVQDIYQQLWHQLDCHIDTFLAPDELLLKCKAGVSYDVVFCDIIMEPFNGIETGRRLRELLPDVYLVYLTSNLEYAPLGYEVDAFRYLLKPVEKETLLSVLDEIQQKRLQQHNLILKTSEGSVILNPEQILYIEAEDKDTHVFCIQDTLFLHKSLNEFESMFQDQPFFRIHRKYLVNLSHVREFDETKLSMDHGKTLSISRRKYKDFQKALEAYIKGGF